MYGPGEMKRTAIPYRSSRLESGYCALRANVHADKVYAGINYLRPETAISTPTGWN